MDEANKNYFQSNRIPKSSSQSSLLAQKNQTLDSNDWLQRQINNIANSGKFSSDRAIAEYCDEIWIVQDLSIPKGSSAPVRVRSFPNVSNEDKIREKMNTTQAPSSFIKT